MTVYDPVGVLLVVVMVRVLVYVGVPLVGFTPTVNPVAVGETDAERLTDDGVPLTRETVTVDVVLLPLTTDPLVGLRLTAKSNGPGAEKAATCAITVFQFWNVESLRYSASIQKVDAAVGVGSVAAPK